MSFSGCFFQSIAKINMATFEGGKKEKDISLILGAFYLCTWLGLQMGETIYLGGGGK